MRGHAIGALGRNYLHSAVTESLWRDVAETEILFSAKMAHAVMLASLYGNPEARLEHGNDQVHEMYVTALNTVPYINATTKAHLGGADELVEEWKRVNAERVKEEAAADGEDDDVHG